MEGIEFAVYTLEKREMFIGDISGVEEAKRKHFKRKGRMVFMASQEEADFRGRIEAMFGRDRLFGWGFVVFLWVTYVFTYWAIMSVWHSEAEGGIKIALIISGILVLVYNAASMGALIKHYSEDLEFIYTVDLRHLDSLKEARKQKRKGGGS